MLQINRSSYRRPLLQLRLFIRKAIAVSKVFLYRRYPHQVSPEIFCPSLDRIGHRLQGGGFRSRGIDLALHLVSQCHHKRPIKAAERVLALESPPVPRRFRAVPSHVGYAKSGIFLVKALRLTFFHTLCAQKGLRPPAEGEKYGEREKAKDYPDDKLDSLSRTAREEPHPLGPRIKAEGNRHDQGKDQPHGAGA